MRNTACECEVRMAMLKASLTRGGNISSGQKSATFLNSNSGGSWLNLELNISEKSTLHLTGDVVQRRRRCP